MSDDARGEPHGAIGRCHASRFGSNTQKENLGIVVQYKVKIKIVVSMGGDLAVELPFTLTHPKPLPTPTPSRTFEPPNPDDQQTVDAPIDHNLIQLDAK